MSGTVVKNIPVVCDKCGRNFKIKAKNVKVKFITDDVEKMYFKCPECGTEYIVSYRDGESRDNIARIVAITKEIQLSQGKLPVSKLNTLEAEYKSLVDRNMELSDRYKAMFK